MEEVQLLQLETSIPKLGESSKTSATLPDMKKFTLPIAAPSDTASNTEETKFL